MGSDMLLFFRDFFGRSSLLEYWMRPYVLCISPAIKLTLKVGYICPFVVIDPTSLGATKELLFQDSCLSILNLSPTQNACLLPMVIKPAV